MRRLFSSVFIAAALFLAPAAQAIAGTVASAPVTLGALKITDGWIKAMLPGQPVGGGYLTIENTGAEGDRLVAVQSPASPEIQIHEMKMEGDVMKMRQLKDGLEIPAGGKIELKPGGYHLMFTEVKEPFKEGAAVKVMLKFEQAGEVEVQFPVGPAAGM